MSDLTCDNCGAVRGPDDVFCESCGMDFLSGSLPEPDSETDGAGTTSGAVTSGAVTSGAVTSGVKTEVPSVPEVPAMPEVPEAEAVPEAPAVPEMSEGSAEEPSESSSSVSEVSSTAEQTKLYIAVEADRGQFDKVVQEGEVDFPNPVPERQVLALAGTEFHIGRTSESRAIFPDLDVFQLTGDEAVSGRHAMIRIDPNGFHSVTDLGSTNGTTVGDVDAELLVEGKATAVEVGAAIFVGAWTKLTVLEPGSD